MLFVIQLLIKAKLKISETSDQCDKDILGLYKMLKTKIVFLEILNVNDNHKNKIFLILKSLLQRQYILYRQSQFLNPWKNTKLLKGSFLLTLRFYRYFFIACSFS